MTREEHIDIYMMSDKDTLANILYDVYRESESRDKELTNRLDNAKKRYESKCQELDDCSAFSTKQALEINDLKSRTCENCKHFIHEPYNEPKCMSDDSKVYYTDKDFGCSEFERIEL